MTTLEHKLEEFLSRFNKLREENRSLRERVLGLESEKNALSEKIQTARERLEVLMERLPEQ